MKKEDIGSSRPKVRPIAGFRDDLDKALQKKDEAVDVDVDDSELDDADSTAATNEPAPKKRWYKRLSQKQWLLISTIILLLVAGATAYILTRPDKTNNVSTVHTDKPKPPAPPESPVSPLTGLEVSAEDAKHIVTGVMIENSTYARPQSGLDKAGVVYEAIAEAGITRFLALYQESKPGSLGPVRSVRPYYIDWASSFDAPLAHVGGSPDALAKIRSGGKDLDQFFNSGAYRRVGSREAPHNVYTTMENLNNLEAQKGWTSSNFTGFSRNKIKDVKPAATPTAKSIDIAISGPTYNVHYDYDAASNSYKRIMGGEPHIDAETHAQITPKVVIGLITAYGLEADGYHSRYQIAGENKAYIFQEGSVVEANWKRETANSQYVFTDNAGQPIKLDPGQTWITVVGSPSAVTYKP